MKHKAVREMVRIQFGIPEDVDINVEFLAFYEEKYEFECTWFFNNTWYQSNFKMPHITSVKTLEIIS